MINIILSILIIHMFRIIVFKVQYTTLNCGIFAWAGKDPKHFNKNKLDILGIFNESRGTHSCGISKDGDILIGIDKNKVYKDFLSNTNYDAPTKVPVVIGHTRLSTFGEHTLDNAHPFGYGEFNKHYEFVGVHNGTLINHLEIARLNNISDKATVVENNISKTRSKIDSEVLLECIYKTKSFNVLSQYNGAAATVFTNLQTPNVMYCFRGASKKSNIVEGIEGERPLFYYKENKNSLYISSMENSLYAIGGTKKTVFEFVPNTVYKITDGDISTAVKYKINRNDNYQTYSTFTPPSKRVEYNEYLDDDDWTDYHGYRNQPRNYPKQPLQKEFVFNANNAINLNKEIYIQKAGDFESPIYFNKLRYWRNGHLISGCFTFVPNFGFYFLGHGLKESDDAFYGLVNKVFLGKDFVNDISTLSESDIKKSFLPFKSTAKNEIKFPSVYYFYKGIRLQTATDYIACLQMDKEYESPFDWRSLSQCAAHPIIEISEDKGSSAGSIVLKFDKPVTDIVCPLGSEKIYTFEEGRCTKITTVVKNNKNLQEVAEALLKHEKKVVETEFSIEDEDETKVIVLQLDDDLLEKDLNDIFKDNLMKFPMYIKRLENYKNNQKAKDALIILEKFLYKSTKLMTYDLKE